MSTRDECLHQAAQTAVDGFAQLCARVRELGPAEAAHAIWHPGHPLSEAEIAERLARLTSTRGAA